MILFKGCALGLIEGKSLHVLPLLEEQTRQNYLEVNAPPLNPAMRNIDLVQFLLFYWGKGLDSMRQGRKVTQSVY